MAKPTDLPESLDLLISITEKTHNEQIRPVAIAIWQKHLQPENPLWKHIIARPFTYSSQTGQAHVMAMVDPRLPGLGFVGFFACTDKAAGVEVLNRATEWLRDEHGVKDVYGPINGTITRDYRFNMAEDFKIPGEPVNPMWYIDVFTGSGFTVFNRYVSGLSKHYRTFIKFLTMRKPGGRYALIALRPFSNSGQMKDLRTYHELMNAIFPQNSIYCPVITWEERVYNMTGSGTIFDPKYSYFLVDKGRAIGFIVAYSYGQKLIVKTIGLLPEYRKHGLAGLLIKRVHDQAASDGLQVAVYSTIRVGNAVYNKMKRPGVTTYRRYITMHKSL